MNVTTFIQQVDDGQSSGAESIESMVSRASCEKKERQLSLFLTSSFTRSVISGEMRCMPSGAMLKTNSYLALTFCPQGVDIFAHAKIFFPIATDKHWSLVVANMQTLRGGPGSGSLEYYDSSTDRIPTLQVMM